MASLDAELAVRTKNLELAQLSYDVAKLLELSNDEMDSVADEFVHVDGLLSQE
jgi:hypothetical protein